MSAILLLVIALIAPWTVHLAPPRQRALAVVGVAAVFLLYAIFAANPILGWPMWAGLAAGIVTILLFASATSGGRRGGDRRPPARPRRPRADEVVDEPTGEI